MRYFFVSYIYNSCEGTIFGNAKMQSLTFPSQKFIKKFSSMIGDCTEEDIGILNIFEFKSKEDFDSFEE